MQKKNPMLRLNKPDSLLFLLVLALCASANAVFADVPPPFVVHSQPDQARITIYSEYYRDAPATRILAPSANPLLPNIFNPPPAISNGWAFATAPGGYASHCKTS